MAIDILMPALSPTMEQGKLAKWLKKEGDQVKPGEVLAEIENEKATMEVEAIHEAWEVQRAFWKNPRRPYWALEPFDASHPEGPERYATLFRRETR